MKNKPQIRNRFSQVRRSVRKVEDAGDHHTQQQFKDECDINRIVQNANRGVPPRYFAQGQPHYGDFSNVPDLMEAHDKIERAKQAFMTLPAGLRGELDNDPRRINEISREQIDRYKLKKTLVREDEEPNPPGASSSPAPAKAASKAAKAAPKGTPAGDEPADD